MKAKVEIHKSFDDGKEFSKTYEAGDFEEFFKEEGAYMDRLCETVESKGKAKDGFTVWYTVTVIK